jgi:deazaflavin-dependent oxidoreductase (nitroreductase family)
MKNQPKGFDTPRGRKIMKALSSFNVKLYRLSKGRIGGSLPTPSGRVAVGLLHHVGRKSGRELSTPLVTMVDGERFVVVASQGGLPENPQWYRNLLAQPEVSYEFRGTTTPVRARTASSDEKAVLWPRLVEMYADYANYQRWTDRDIPVVILDPR